MALKVGDLQADQQEILRGALNALGLSASTLEGEALEALGAKAEQWAVDILSQQVGVVITAGVGGDCPDMLSAIAAAKKYRPGFVNKGLQVEVRLKSGYKINQQVFVVQDDLSYIKLTHEDWINSGVTGKIVSSAINQNNGNASTNNWRTGTYPVFCAMRNGVLPFIASLFEFDDSGAPTAAGNPARAGTVGVYVFEGGRAVIGRNCGVIGAGWRGLYVDGGYAYDRDTVWRKSGIVGGPDTASFVAGHGYGIRVSNNGMAMSRGADVSESEIGVYVSKGFIDANDMNAQNCRDIAFAVTDHGYMTVSGANANGSAAGFRVDQGGNLYGGESSETAGAYPRAAVAGYAVVAMLGSIVVLDSPTLSGTATNAALVRNSELRINGGSVTTTAVRSAVSIEQGGSVKLYGTKVEGLDTYDIELADGSDATISGVFRVDGVTPVRANVRGGEFSPNGTLFGRDDRRALRATDVSVSIFSSSAPEQFATANFTQGRNYSLYDSTNYPWKRHTITHAGTGSSINVYKDAANTVRLASLRAGGDSVSVAPDGLGGWIVTSLMRKPFARALSSTTLTMTPSTGDFIYSSTAITVERVITMYAASDGAAQSHTFTRADAGAGTWSIREPDGTAVIAILAANQWATIMKKTDGSAWFVASRG